MKRELVCTLTAASLVLMLTARTSVAQNKPAPKAVAPAPPPAPPSLADTLTDGAKADYDAAKLLFADGDYGGAVVKFTNAYEKANDPRLLWNIAACEKNLRHYANVLTYVRKYLKDGAAVLSPADMAEAEALITAIEPFTAGLAMKVNEADAKVFVDDALVGTTPLERPIVVDIGVRKLRVAKDGFEDFTKDLPIGGAKEVRLDVTLTKVVHQGTLVVNAHPGDEVFVDGARVGMGTWRGVVPSGGHMLRVTAPEMRGYQSDIVVRDNETRTVAISLEKEVKPSSGMPTWAWIGGGAILIAAASVGGYFLFRPEDKQAVVPVGNLEPGNVQASIPTLRFR